jgi:hypothetical protein
MIAFPLELKHAIFSVYESLQGKYRIAKIAIPN